MFTVFAILAGLIDALLVVQNGQFAKFYGDYSAAAVIHLLGLITASVWCVAARKSLPQRQKAKPWMFFGGMVGVGTTMFTSLAFGGVGVTAIVGLSLLGQSITSIVVDQFGLFGARRSPFFAGKLLGLMAVLAGVCVMVFPLTGANVGAVLCALAAGVAIVVARTINAQLAERHGAMRSTVMNYVAGLATTVVLMLIAGRNDPLWTDFQLSSNWFMYLGGPVSVLLIMLMNITVNKVPALAMTLLMFSGRIFAGLGLDYVLYGSFSWQSAAGGALVACGMCLNVWMENRRNVKLAASTDDAA